uniref:fibronectin type III domain-containing protein 9 n=1 Tax=Doryrhamphus excisus TaxID=161450 RepID=UPI0025AE6CA5|nr:fibronectin type III domain-containing protein 9 [Doryrhamphus excisus]XP_057930148.1 fibronectin type III domain-containing protein 9 [Doryrhamphus excisus]
MAITVYNISSTSARVSWPPSPACLDTFYSVMYDPNWNSLLMGFKRKSFMHEERIPVSQTTAHLANLLPQTTYFLCVTCQAANPVRDQCQVFVTLSDSSEAQDRAGWEMAKGVWLTCCVLLLVIAAILLWGCLHTTCAVPGQGSDSRPAVTNVVGGDHLASGRLYTPRGSCDNGAKRGAVMHTPLLSAHAAKRDHELRTLAKLSGSEPA